MAYEAVKMRVAMGGTRDVAEERRKREREEREARERRQAAEWEAERQRLAELEKRNAESLRLAERERAQREAERHRRAREEEQQRREEAERELAFTRRAEAEERKRRAEAKKKAQHQKAMEEEERERKKEEGWQAIQQKIAETKQKRRRKEAEEAQCRLVEQEEMKHREVEREAARQRLADEEERKSEMEAEREKKHREEVERAAARQRLAKEEERQRREEAEKELTRKRQAEAEERKRRAEAKREAQRQKAAEEERQHRQKAELEIVRQRIAEKRHREEAKEQAIMEAEQQKLVHQEEQKQREEAEWNMFQQRMAEEEQQRHREEAKDVALQERHQKEEMEREAERQELAEEVKKEEMKCREEERALNEYKNNPIGKVKCSGQEYEDAINENKEVSLQSSFTHQLTIPLKIVQIPSSSVEDRLTTFSAENQVTSTNYPTVEDLDSVKDDSDGSLEDDASSNSDDDDVPEMVNPVDEVYRQIWAMEFSDDKANDQEWLMKAQTFCLFHFSKEKGLNETQLDMLLYDLSSASFLSDSKEFFRLTKGLAALCIVSSEAGSEDETLQTSSLRGLLYCCGIKCGYLKTVHVNMMSVDDKELLQMVPSLTEASLHCLVSLSSPSTSFSVDSDQLRQSIHYIETHQVPLKVVKDAITYNPQFLMKSLQSSIEKRSDKSLVQLVRELSQNQFSGESKLLSGGILMTIMDCMSSQKIEHMQTTSLTEARKALTEESLAEAREALIRLSGVSISVKDDLASVVSYLSYALYASKKYKPRLTQLISLSILLLSHEQKKNCLLEVLTGEGKSCIIAMFAAALGMLGKKVDIVTSSSVLAQRDAKVWADFYAAFALTATHNTETKERLTTRQKSKADKKRESIYSHNIVYGTVGSFSADILREKFEMREVRGDRGFQAAIVDEVDMLMMDEGVQFTYLSHRLALLRHIEPIIALVWAAVRKHSPLLTVDGEVLFADVANYFDEVVPDDINTGNFP